jgi:hypothetical protein
MLIRAASRAACVIGVAAGAILLSPGSAVGGSYVVAQCDGSVNPVQGEAFAVRSGVEYDVSADCTGGSGLAISHPGGSVSDGAFGRWVWSAPPGTVFTEIDAAAILVGGGGDQAALAGVTGDGRATEFGAQGSVFGPADELSGEFATFRAGLTCRAGSCSGGPAVTAAVRDVLLRTADRSDPAVSITGGRILTEDVVRGGTSVEFAASDQGGGIHSLEVAVNGEAVDADRLPCEVSADFALSLQPCPGGATRTQLLATSAEPFETGPNELEVCAFDLALDGVANSDCATERVFVDDVCPESEVGSGSVLSAQFPGNRNKARVRSDRPVRLKGKLRTADGEGVGGATVCALTHVRSEGAPYVLARTAVTGDKGGFRLRLPAGPSREVYLHRVFGNEVLARHGLSTAASVRPSFEVKPGKRAGAVRAGDRLHFHGKLPGPNCANRDVKIQAKVGKRRWQVFRSPTTDRKCRYRTRYKLGRTSRPTRYLFRARVRKQGGYPYGAGVSTVRARRAVPSR